MKRAVLMALVLPLVTWPVGAQDRTVTSEPPPTQRGCSCEGVNTDRVKELIGRHPSGSALSDALAAEVVAGTISVDEVICEAGGATGSRVLDIADGLAEATLVASQSRPDWVREQIQRLQCAETALQSAFYAARATSIYAAGIGKTVAPVEPVSRSRP